MYYYLYRITNKVNGRFYIGVHKTNNLEDGYMGSGKIIQQAIKKYGIDNFEKEIIEFFNNEKEMMDKETEIVNEEFLKKDEVYNLKRGGFGGFDYINKMRLSKTPNSLKKLSSSLIEYYSKIPNENRRKTFFGKKHSNSTKSIISEKRKEFFLNGGEHPRGMLGKKHKKETKDKQRKASIENSPLRGKLGIDHPTGGKTWYNNGISHIRSFNHPGVGWVEGRIFKKRNRKKG